MAPQLKETTNKKTPPDRLILICEKCGIKLSPEKTLARDLQQKLKAACKSDPTLTQTRPVVSSCLGVCPEGEMTIAFVGMSSGSGGEWLKIKEPDSTATLEQILTHARS